jgi:leucyl aminopeptidase
VDFQPIPPVYIDVFPPEKEVPTEITPSEDRAADVACDALVIGAFADEGEAALAGADDIASAFDDDLLEHARDLGFKGKLGDIALLPSMGRVSARVVALVGLGKHGRVDAAVLRRASAAAARRLSSQSSIATTLHEALGGSAAASAVTEGFLLGSYRYAGHKSDPVAPTLQRVELVGASPDAVSRGRTLGEATRLARDLINEPADTMTPDVLARKAREIADVNGLGCEIFEEDALRERGFGGILGVARGSAQPPRFIALRYSPENARSKVAIVGKGVTFDSGGYSIKPAKGMETMKTDMAGAAAVLATMSGVARLGISTEVLAFIPATENMVSGEAIKPGDVITHHGGKTSEVLNTDAEGRLVLADALHYASEQGPKAIVDVATLTGAIQIALGKKIGGMFANDDTLLRELQGAAESAGERFWHMPLAADVYRSEIDSDVADIKNTGTSSPYGGATIGALFLREFVGEGIPWAHLDIAGVGRSDGDYEDVSRGGTGVATRTLLTWLEGRR